MKHFHFLYYSDRQVRLEISESHWWWTALVHAADAICALTRHRLCNSLVSWIYDLDHRHTRHQLAIPVTREDWQAWAKVTGAEDPSWHWEDEPQD
jgi:hypothetical protein